MSDVTAMIMKQSDAAARCFITFMAVRYRNRAATPPSTQFCSCRHAVPRFVTGAGEACCDQNESAEARNEIPVTGSSVFLQCRCELTPGGAGEWCAPVHSP